MGCDIHGWVEVRDGGKWVAVREIKDQERNYQRFAALAGVRGEGPPAKGMPHDISDTVRYHIERCGVDGHSHSHLSLVEAAEIWLATSWFVNDHARKHPKGAFIGWYDEETPEAKVRVVFWFDN